MASEKGERSEAGIVLASEASVRRRECGGGMAEVEAGEE